MKDEAEEHDELLGSSRSSSESLHLPKLRDAAPPRPSNYSTSTLISAIACIICILLNLYIFHSSKDNRVLTFRDVVRLRRPNQFIGLEQVYMNDSEHVQAVPSKLVYPNLLSIISQTDSDKAYGDDIERFASWDKLLAPEDRLFKVNHEISTIVEFMAIDYKMEICELRLITPTSSEITNTTIIDTSSPNLVDIWQLETRPPLDPSTLSWRTRPRRSHKIDTINIGFGLEYSHRFRCPQNTCWVFEISAASERTAVEWTQDHANPNPRVCMIQSSSLEDSSP